MQVRHALKDTQPQWSGSRVFHIASNSGLIRNASARAAKVLIHEPDASQHCRHRLVRSRGPAAAGAAPSGDELSDRPRLDSSPSGVDDDLSAPRGRRGGRVRIDRHRRTVDGQANHLRVLPAAGASRPRVRSLRGADRGERRALHGDSIQRPAAVGDAAHLLGPYRERSDRVSRQGDDDAASHGGGPALQNAGDRDTPLHRAARRRPRVEVWSSMARRRRPEGSCFTTTGPTATSTWTSPSPIAAAASARIWSRS